MKVITYHEEYDLPAPLEDFLALLFGQQLTYFASDLLSHGLSPSAVTEAVRKAMLAARAANLNLREHFQLMYTASQDKLIRDCKLSNLGYALVLLNADVKNTTVANWQVKLVMQFLTT